MSITATVRVQYESSSDTNLLLDAIIDDRDDGLNGGKTNGFPPGTDVYILTFLNSKTDHDSQTATAGTIQRSSSNDGLYEVTERLFFANDSSKSIRYPVAASGSFNTEWLGVDGGNPSLSSDQRTISFQNPTVGLLEVKYEAAFEAFRLTGVPSKIPEVGIIFIGKSSA